MKIIRKAVHQDDRRLFARIFSDVNAVLISLHEMFQVSGDGVDKIPRYVIERTQRLG